MSVAKAIWTAVDIVAALLREPRPEPRRMAILDTVQDSFQTSGMLRLVDPVSKTVPKPPAYDPDAAPGRFEHRSIDCDRHGPNVAGYRAYKGSGPYQCCACAADAAEAPRMASLGEAWTETVKQRQKALQALGWRE